MRRFYGVVMGSREAVVGLSWGCHGAVMGLSWALVGSREDITGDLKRISQGT